MASSCVGCSCHCYRGCVRSAALLPGPTSGSVTDACAYGGVRRSDCDLQRLSGLLYLIRSRAWRTGRVLNLSRSRSAVSFAIITCLQKETVEFHALSLSNMVAIMLPSENPHDLGWPPRDQASVPSTYVTLPIIMTNLLTSFI